jgi:hypothetical protein
VPRLIDAFHRDQLRRDVEDAVDRNGEADALRARADGDVDPDHFPVDVQQRPA